MGTSFDNINRENKYKNKIEWAFPKYEEAGPYTSKGPGKDFIEHLSTSVDAISDWFKQYQVESIELWITGMMQTEGVTKLILGIKGKRGMSVRLKPKPQQ